MDNNQINQEVEQKNLNSVREESYFDGTLLGYIGWSIVAFLLTFFTLGIGAPWAACLLYSYQFKHTVYSGKRLKFEGKGGDYFLNILKWVLLSIITLGIYSIVVPVREARWIVSKLHFEDEEYVKGDSYFNGHTIQLIGLNILSTILIIFSLGILYPFTVCIRLRWINKHSVINKKQLAFEGTGLSLIWKYIVWTFFTIITLGIFSLWIPILELKWQSKNVRILKPMDKGAKFDKSWLVAIPMIILGGLLAWFLVTKAIDYDWARSNVELKVLNAVTKVQERVGKEDDIDDVKKAMYTIMVDKKENGYLSDAEMNELVDKYELSDAKREYEKDSKKYMIDDPIEMPKDSKKSTTEKDKPVENNSYITVNGYKVSFGTYTGEDSLFDMEKQEVIPVHIKVVLESDGITLDGAKRVYAISGDKIMVDGMPIIQVDGDNKLVYLAQSCPTLTYQGK